MESDGRLPDHLEQGGGLLLVEGYAPLGEVVHEGVASGVLSDDDLPLETHDVRVVRLVVVGVLDDAVRMDAGLVCEANWKRWKNFRKNGSMD